MAKQIKDRYVCSTLRYTLPAYMYPTCLQTRPPTQHGNHNSCLSGQAHRQSHCRPECSSASIWWLLLITCALSCYNFCYIVISSLKLLHKSCWRLSLEMFVSKTLLSIKRLWFPSIVEWISVVCAWWCVVVWSLAIQRDHGLDSFHLSWKVSDGMKMTVCIRVQNVAHSPGRLT